MLLFGSIEINNFPVENSISTFSCIKLLIFAAKAVAHAAVPQAFVKPAPLSQTFTLIRLSLIFFA